MKENTAVKITPKMSELIKWEKIEYVNNMLDSGTSPAQACRWINKNGFKISPPLVYEYEKLRQRAVLDGVTIEKFLGISVAGRSASIKATPQFETKKKKLRNDMEALNRIINMGYESLDKYENKPMPVSILLQAIKLKHELTDGYYTGLTEYGIQQLQELERRKYDMLFDLMYKYVPDDKKEIVKKEIDLAEDDFYKHTDYYEEYLRASGLPLPEVAKKMKEYEELRAKEDLQVIRV